jgi:hypothetical protein
MSTRYPMLVATIVIGGCLIAAEARPAGNDPFGGYRVVCIPDDPQNGIIVISPFTLADLARRKRLIGSVYHAEADKKGLEKPERYFLGRAPTEQLDPAHGLSSVTIDWTAQIITDATEQLVTPISTTVSLARGSVSFPSADELFDRAQLCGDAPDRPQPETPPEKPE